MSDEMDAFLKGKAEAEPAPEAEAPPEQEAAPEAEAPPEAEPEGEGEPQQQTRDGRTVPLAALEGERKARQDWKDKAARAETERDELRKQLEEIKRQAEQARQAPQQPQLTPEQEQFERLAEIAAQRVEERNLNNRLNRSEQAARAKHGPDAVDAAVNEFKRAMQANPQIQSLLYQQDDPYGWLIEQAQHVKDVTEFTSNREAFLARERERWLAEQAAQQPAPQRVSPAAGMAPSLANVRSAAPRGAPAFSGPTPMGDLLPNG
jgi:hypothetical protein